MPSTDDEHAMKPLRILIANERQDRLLHVAQILQSLGHEVIAPQIDVEEVGAFTQLEQPDVAFVGLGESTEHALELIERIVYEATCPVVALLSEPDQDFVAEAARRGVFAYATDEDPDGDWQNAIEIAMRRFAQLKDMEDAFGRRVLTERAKGILMERHGVDDHTALQMLRTEALGGGALIDAAQAVIDGVPLTSEPLLPAG